MFTIERITYSFRIKQAMMILTNINQKNETAICKEIINAVNIYRKTIESVYNYVILFL